MPIWCPDADLSLSYLLFFLVCGWINIYEPAIRGYLITWWFTPRTYLHILYKILNFKLYINYIIREHLKINKKFLIHTGHAINIVIIVSDCVIFEGWVMVFNATFNNISVRSWRSVLLVEETRVPRESHRHVTNHWQTLSHNVVLWIRFLS